MKLGTLLFLSLLVFCNFGYSQNTSEVISKDQEVILDEVPIFPGCKRKKSQESLKKCMSDKVSKFISKKYDVDIFDDLDLPEGRYKVVIMFKLDKQGDVIDAKARGPHPLLEKEAIKVINKLPRVIPGKAKGKPVIIPFSIPIYLSSN
jgi:protein TonB